MMFYLFPSRRFFLLWVGEEEVDVCFACDDRVAGCRQEDTNSLHVIYSIIWNLNTSNTNKTNKKERELSLQIKLE